MARVHALIGVAVCLMAVVIGCKSPDISGLLAINQGPSMQTIDGSLDLVALSTKDSLEKLKLKVDLSQEGQDTYYLSSKSSNGARFRLVLTRDRTGAAEKTNMRLEWLDPRDSSFGLHLLVDVASLKSA